ncbi:hypothetical protein [Paenibacillus sp. JNUCC31]|uniref:hypothetical protein n=1 Tax=Paenibacillus sp. JNUCC-31 TaxID=2777983 RepID=UPI001E37BA9F|nr:hypothetical protein [Paenibacillus sp. JNUCC-31]
MAWKNFQQHLNALELQLRDLSPAVFKKQVLPSLLDEPFGADIKPFQLQPSSAHTFTDEHLFQLLALMSYWMKVPCELTMGKEGSHV